MSLSRQTVLTTLLARDRAAGEPTPPEDLAASFDAPTSRVRDTLETLREMELVEGTDDGYRPTQTAYDLDDLDVEFDDVLVLDIVEA